jgi:hypothetical protein
VLLDGTFTFPSGLFRDRDQVAARATVLLN